MRRSQWRIGTSAFAVAALVAVAGTSIGGDVGLDAATPGILALTGSLYVLAALAIRQRVWRRLAAQARPATQAARLAGRRVF